MKLFLATLATATLPVVVCAQMQAARPIDFAKDVHPLLQSRCTSCHSGDSAQAGLHLDSREALLRGGKSGPAVIPGQPSESLLILKVTGQHGLPMPPSGPRLTPDAVAILRAWIEQGAKWDLAATASSEPATMAPRNPPVPPGTAPIPSIASSRPIGRAKTQRFRRRSQMRYLLEGRISIFWAYLPRPTN